MQLKIFALCLVLIILFQTKFLVAQGRPYEGPDDPASDVAAERIGEMNGNRISLPFHNSTELGNWPQFHARWPNDEHSLRI